MKMKMKVMMKVMVINTWTGRSEADQEYVGDAVKTTESTNRDDDKQVADRTDQQCQSVDKTDRYQLCQRHRRQRRVSSYILT